MKNPIAFQLSLDFGVTPEQACIMCHLSANCDKCCKQCQAKGTICDNSMQACSQVNLEYQGPRWRTWMYHVAVYFPELKKYVPKKYHKEIELERKIYNHKMKHKMKYPDRYKDREELIASLTDEVIEELRYMEFKINNWNDDVGLNRIIIDNEDWYIDLDIVVDGYVEEDSGDYYTPPEAWLKSVESHSEGDIYLKDGEEEYEIEVSLVNNLLYQVDRYIEDRYA